MLNVLGSAIRSLNLWLDRRWARQFQDALMLAFETRANSIQPGMPGHFDCSTGVPASFRYARTPLEASVEIAPLHGFVSLLTCRVSVTRLPTRFQARLLRPRGGWSWEAVADTTFVSEPNAAQVADWALPQIRTLVTQFDDALVASFNAETLELDDYGPEPIQSDSGWVYFVRLEGADSMVVDHTDPEYQLGIAHPYLGTMEDSYARLLAAGPDGRWACIASRDLRPTSLPRDIAIWVRESIERQLG